MRPAIESANLWPKDFAKALYLAIAVAVALIGPFVLSLQACSCLGFGPACSEALSPSNSAIFLGRVESIGYSLFSFFRGTVSVDFSVQETFKGKPQRRVKVNTKASEAACGFPFEVGKQYIVYATEEWAGLYTSICHRTIPLEIAEQDLQYLRNLPTLPETSTIFGSYKRYTYDPAFIPKYTPSIMDHYSPPEEYYRAMAPMTGETVTATATDGQIRRSKIDKDGSFMLSGLSPGTYKVEVTFPVNLTKPRGYVRGRGPRTESVEVSPKGCAQVTFRAEPNGRLSGRIIDANGRALPNVEIRVWVNKPAFVFWLADSSVKNADDGTFDIGGLPPGEYVLGAYVLALPSGYPQDPETRDRLFRATLRYCPGTPERNSAKVINLKYAQHISNIILRIPLKLEDWKNARDSK